MKEYFVSGQTVLFQGDSVTDCGRDRSRNDLGPGYPAKIATVYHALFPHQQVNFVNRGVSGDRVRNLLARYEEDFLAVRPDFISILIGVNDTWRRYDSGEPNPAEQFEAEYEKLLRMLKKDLPGAKIMILEPFLLPVSEERASWREDLNPKISAVRTLAAKYADFFIPMDSFMAVAQRAAGPQALAADGVHPTDRGHGQIAARYLEELKIL